MELTDGQKRVIYNSYHSVGKVIPNSGVSDDYIEGYKDGIMDILLTLDMSIEDVLKVEDPR